MVERVRNIIKRDCKKSKRPLPEDVSVPSMSKKRDSSILRRYPSTSLDSVNIETMQQHLKAIGTELSKSRPRDVVLLPLMKSTFSERRMYVLNEASSLDAILTKYPALSRSAVVSYFHLL